MTTSRESAAADSQAVADEARHHFEEGTAAFNIGEFARAADEYRDAYRLRHDPAILYNIAQAYRLANDARQAIFFYRSYLRSLPEASNREEVETRIRKLEAEPSTAQPSSPASSQQPVTTLGPPLATAPSAAVAKPRARDRVPAYKKWWLWTIVGVAVAGAGVGIGFAITDSHSSRAPATALGVTNVF